MQTTISEATVADAETLSVLVTEVWLDTYARDGVTPAHAAHLLREYSPAAFRASMQAEGITILVCRSGENILGCVRLLTALQPLDPAYGTAELTTLYVRRRHRGQGLGRALLRTALDLAASRGHRRLYLTVNHANPDAMAFYEAEGFRHVGDWSFDFEGMAVPNLVYSAGLRPAPGGPPAAA